MENKELLANAIIKAIPTTMKDKSRGCVCVAKSDKMDDEERLESCEFQY